jgi:hypothetical protein
VPDYSSSGLFQYQRLLGCLAEMMVKKGAADAEAESVLSQFETAHARAEALREQALLEAREMARPEGGQASGSSGTPARRKSKGKKKGGKGRKKGGKGKKRNDGPSAAAGGGAAATEHSQHRAQHEGEETSKGQAQLEGQEEDGEEEEEEQDDEEEECSVCLLELDEGEDGDTETLLLCRHRFHSRCLDLWTANCREKRIDATCPMCRAAVMRGS